MDQNFPILHCLVGSKMHLKIHNHFWIQPTIACCVDDIINRPRRDVKFIEAVRMKPASIFKVLHIFKLFKPHSSENTDISYMSGVTKLRFAPFHAHDFRLN